MSTLETVLPAVVVVLACAQFGGGLYEYRVLDPVWPSRPAIVQPGNGGVSRRRFWTPAHAAFELALVVSVIACWSHAGVRDALLVAVASHGVMRVWSMVDLTPKAVALERGDPATIDRAIAQRWARRSVLRLPLDAVTCGAALTALVSAA